MQALILASFPDPHSLGPWLLMQPACSRWGPGNETTVSAVLGTALMISL